MGQGNKPLHRIFSINPPNLVTDLWLRKFRRYRSYPSAIPYLCYH
jgi:hypothetical protein